MAKPININLSSVGSKIKNHLGIVFVLVLLVLFGLEGLVLKNSLDLIVNFRPSTESVQSKGVRVNFVNYDAVTKTIDSASTYQSPGEHIQNPFTSITPAGQ